MTSRRTLSDKALAALDEAVAGVVERHRKDGRKLAVWRNGRVVRITADQASRLRARHAACPTN
jgi:hypothetical protein